MMNSPENEKPRRGLAPVANSLKQPLDLFEQHHLLDNGPLVLRNDATGLGQRRGLEARKAAQYLKSLKPMDVGWGAPKKASAGL